MFTIHQFEMTQALKRKFNEVNLAKGNERGSIPFFKAMTACGGFMCLAANADNPSNTAILIIVQSNPKGWCPRTLNSYKRFLEEINSRVPEANSWPLPEVHKPTPFDSFLEVFPEQPLNRADIEMPAEIREILELLFK